MNARTNGTAKRDICTPINGLIFSRPTLARRTKSEGLQTLAWRQKKGGNILVGLPEYTDSQRKTKTWVED